MKHRLASLWETEPFRFADLKEAITPSEWTPHVDITEDDHEFLVKAELPDMKRDDVKVSIEDGTLMISGERKHEKEEKHKKYHRIECEYGSFTRSFTLPAGVSGDKVSADFKDGVLRVHLPKDVKTSAAKAIEVKAG